MNKVINKGIAYIGSYWDAKTFQLVDQDGNVLCTLKMENFQNALEAYEGAFTKVIYS